MAKKCVGMFGPSISLWQYGVTMAGMGCSVLFWPKLSGILIFGGLMVFGGAVEGIVIVVKGD